MRWWMLICGAVYLVAATVIAVLVYATLGFWHLLVVVAVVVLLAVVAGWCWAVTESWVDRTRTNNARIAQDRIEREWWSS
jgi:uncharacterized protein YqhQ